MAVSVIDIYKDVLPKTNCGDCGFNTCFAFASMVIVEKNDIGRCPHIEKEIIEKYRRKLKEQYEEGKWVKKDLAKDALVYARERSSSMEIEDLPQRIGGELKHESSEAYLELPYFNDHIIIKKNVITKKDGTQLNPWEQVFIYNHMAQGGTSLPSGEWISFHDIPNTIPKIKSMKNEVEAPLVKRFKGKVIELLDEAALIGGESIKDGEISADAVILFKPMPRVPVMLLFWDEDKSEGFDAEVKLHFDKTVTEHLDIESIMFLSERIRQLLCGDED